MDRTRSNLTLAALLLAVGYIVGQAVGPRGADAGVAAVREDRIVTTLDDHFGNLVVWQLQGQQVIKATAYSLTSQDGRNLVQAVGYDPKYVANAGR